MVGEHARPLCVAAAVLIGFTGCKKKAPAPSASGGEIEVALPIRMDVDIRRGGSAPCGISVGGVDSNDRLIDVVWTAGGAPKLVGEIQRGADKGTLLVALDEALFPDRTMTWSSLGTRFEPAQAVVSQGSLLIAGSVHTSGGADFWWARAADDLTLDRQWFVGRPGDDRLGGFALHGDRWWTVGKQAEAGGAVWLEVDPSGAVRGERTLAEGDADVAAAFPSADDGLWVVGSITRETTGPDAWAMRLDASGETTWERDWPATGPNTLDGGVALADGGALLWGRKNTPAEGQTAWVVRVDAAGRTVWEHNKGTGGYERIYGAAVLGSHGFALVGERGETPAAGDGWTFTIGADGKTLWSRSMVSTSKSPLVLKRVEVVGQSLVVFGHTQRDGQWDLFLRQVRLDGSNLCESAE